MSAEKGTMTDLTRRDVGMVAAALALGASVMIETSARADESPDERAKKTEQQMTDDERFALLVSVMGANFVSPVRDPRLPQGLPMSAGFTPGVPRLGVPALRSSDASLGITNPGYRPDDAGATALPASLSVASSFNPALARAGGALIGREARVRGFNAVLAGGINLTRDVRNGRNFEYFSEDPLLSGVLGAEAVQGIQSEGVISTLKHFCLNCNETNRHWLDAIIDPAGLRETDLLAFQIAIERANPGAIMSSYNKINGSYAGGNSWLLSELLKGAWGFRGWVMSDWGATPNWEFALAGLDQESGSQIDRIVFGDEPFIAPLRNAFNEAKLPKARLSDMVCRILRSMYAVGIDRWGAAPQVDMASHHAVALETARQGIVLLKNDGVLPLAGDTTAKIAVIGGHADQGVPVGTGSSAVLPVGGYAAEIKIGGPHPLGLFRNLYLVPPSPLAELKKLLPKAKIEFDSGQSPAEATLLARRSDIVIVFGIRVEGEGFDYPDMTLPWGQDEVISAVTSVNPNTIVVFETGNPIAMPWHDRAKAILQAWYPGQGGAQALAEILTGRVNPSGKLPMTWPQDLAQTPRPELPGLGTPWGTPTTIRYEEGAEVGYRWYAQKRLAPAYSFGHGLSYTSFAYRDLELHGGDTVAASVTVTNTGSRDGADVAQLYLTHAAGEDRLRLIAFARVALKSGESRRITLAADPRLLARFDMTASRWRITAGAHRVAVGRSASDLVLEGGVQLDGRMFGV
jgi:beta-glucosidase